MSMQMDAEFQKEQNGTLFVWVGALGGGYWGGGGARAPKPKNRVDVQYFFFRRLLVQRSSVFLTGAEVSVPPGAEVKCLSDWCRGCMLKL